MVVTCAPLGLFEFFYSGFSGLTLLMREFDSEWRMLTENICRVGRRLTPRATAPRMQERARVVMSHRRPQNNHLAAELVLLLNPGTRH